MSCCCIPNQGSHINNRVYQEPIFICPMHPEIIASKAGKCPKCGMVLEIRDPNSRYRNINTEHSGHSSSNHASGCH